MSMCFYTTDHRIIPFTRVDEIRLPESEEGVVSLIVDYIKDNELQFGSYLCCSLKMANNTSADTI